MSTITKRKQTSSNSEHESDSKNRKPNTDEDVDHTTNSRDGFIVQDLSELQPVKTEVIEDGQSLPGSQSDNSNVLPKLVQVRLEIKGQETMTDPFQEIPFFLCSTKLSDPFKFICLRFTFLYSTGKYYTISKSLYQFQEVSPNQRTGGRLKLEN